MLRLLCTVTGQFIEVNATKRVHYAILSHTWSTDGHEQSFSEFREIQRSHGALASILSQSDQLDQVPTPPDGSDSIQFTSIWGDERISDKIKNACAVARDYGYRFLWIDSCCIDKTSSAELSEAINSMYTWYSDSSVCFAYLADVEDEDQLRKQDSDFRQSRWFRRGWTLQELIAPGVVIFLSRSWRLLGTKTELVDILRDVTKIDQSVLIHNTPLSNVSVATRMSWMSERNTTRKEDEAYALLGIFDINMPTLYGEGARAFTRLQEEILRRIPDDSIFAWGTFSDQTLFRRLPWNYRGEPECTGSLLAPSPSRFVCADTLELLPLSEFTLLLGVQSFRSEYAFTPYGLRVKFPLLPARSIPSRVRFSEQQQDEECFFAILACKLARSGNLLGIPCTMRRSEPHSLKPAMIFPQTSDHSFPRRLAVISPYDVHACCRLVQTDMFYIQPYAQVRLGEHQDFTSLVALSLALWSEKIMQDKGYKISLEFKQHGFVSISKNIVISNGTDTGFTISPCPCEVSQRGPLNPIHVTAHVGNRIVSKEGEGEGDRWSGECTEVKCQCMGGNVDEGGASSRPKAFTVTKLDRFNNPAKVALVNASGRLLTIVLMRILSRNTEKYGRAIIHLLEVNIIEELS